MFLFITQATKSLSSLSYCSFVTHKPFFPCDTQKWESVVTGLSGKDLVNCFAYWGFKIPSSANREWPLLTKSSFNKNCSSSAQYKFMTSATVKLRFFYHIYFLNCNKAVCRKRAFSSWCFKSFKKLSLESTNLIACANFSYET